MAATISEDAMGAQAPDRRRYLILAICCMSLFIVGLDNTIVNVALPSIRRELHASVPQLQWTIDSYTLVLASLLMLSGSMADRFGRARVFKLGLVLFTLGSLLCSLAPSLGFLIAFRMIQAVGGSMMNPVAPCAIARIKRMITAIVLPAPDMPFTNSKWFGCSGSNGSRRSKVRPGTA